MTQYIRQGDMKHFPDYYRPLSNRLCKVMDDLGASCEVRDSWHRTYSHIEILESIPLGSGIAVYFFGSSAEGTTTIDLNSDYDRVFLLENFPVVLDTSDSSSYASFLLIQDKNTPAGYAKLQYVLNRVSLFARDLKCKDFVKYFNMPKFLSSVDQSNRLLCYCDPADLSVTEAFEIHGPAVSTENHDNLLAVNCSEWPDCALEWLNRQRHYNSPSSGLVEKCKSQGCLLVPVGHPGSEERNLQWRLSFSHQEKWLVSLFNSVQLKCYILLKIIKKEILQVLTGGECISSYHCKTCMFFMIENTPGDFWVPENLITCVITCLSLLKVWIDTGICPNYFIPAENMFEGKLSVSSQQTLSRAVHSLLLSDAAFLLKLQTGKFAERVHSSIIDVFMGPRPEWPDMRKRTKVTLRITKLLRSNNIRNSILYSTCSGSGNNVESNVKSLYKYLVKLKNTRRFTHHTEKQTQDAISLVLPYIELNLMSAIIASSVKRPESEGKIFSLLVSDTWHRLCLKSDSFSSKLKQACLMYTLGYYSISLDVLSALDAHEKYSVCFCDRAYAFRSNDPQLLDYSANHTTNQILHHYVIPCVVFLPTEKDLIPSALCYEMIRSNGSRPGSRHENIQYWYEWAVVDGQFLLYFLLYLNHKMLNMTSHKTADIDNMNIIISYKSLSHKETCLNLLGWVYKNESCIDRAITCFRKSLELQPEHNAARWHKEDVRLNQ